jgi:hypothetical protein
LSPRLFLLRCIEPGLSLLPGYMVCDQSRVQLMSIAGVETNWAARAQKVEDGPPPALGYWQFQADGVAGVLEAQRSLMTAVCATLDIPPTSIWSAIQYNDPLACVVARLLLWSDREALPAIGDANGGFDYYVRNWRPGKPDKTRWGPAYSTACSTVASK